MRAINPFSYFVDYASQLSGFGGERPSPDPQYCFHTRYEAVRPGRAIYRLKLLGSQASEGELTVRVHAFRPDFGGAPSLAAGNRLDLGSERKQDLEAAVLFHAISGVEYALYGFFSEPTNLVVDQIEILLDEPEGGEDVEIEAPRSVLAEPAGAPEAGPATGLIHHGAVELTQPVSQDCTWRQLEAGGSVAERKTRWREAVCAAAPAAYGVDLPGLDCWFAGNMPVTKRGAATANVPVLYPRGEAPARESGEFADVILWPRGPRTGGGARERWVEVYGWLERLKIGGLAAIGLNYLPDAAQSGELSRNEIRQWAFRLIGLGYSVAPLAFAGLDDLVVDETGAAACCLIVRRQ